MSNKLINFVDQPLVIRRDQLKNHDFTIISQNCVGGFIYHQLGLKFLTPTINLYFYPHDFIELVRHLRFYMNTELVEDKTTTKPFPVGILGDRGHYIRIYFNHSKNFTEAKQKWLIRSQRINYQNIFIIGGDAYGEPYSNMEYHEFDTLPYRHKVLLTGRSFPKVKSTVPIPDCNINGHLGQWWNLIPGNIRGSRYFENWDYIKFLNQSD